VAQRSARAIGGAGVVVDVRSARCHEKVRRLAVVDVGGRQRLGQRRLHGRRRRGRRLPAAGVRLLHRLGHVAAIHRIAEEQPQLLALERLAAIGHAKDRAVTLLPQLLDRREPVEVERLDDEVRAHAPLHGLLGQPLAERIAHLGRMVVEGVAPADGEGVNAPVVGRVHRDVRHPVGAHVGDVEVAVVAADGARDALEYVGGVRVVRPREVSEAEHVVQPVVVLLAIRRAVVAAELRLVGDHVAAGPGQVLDRVDDLRRLLIRVSPRIEVPVDPQTMVERDLGQHLAVVERRIVHVACAHDDPLLDSRLLQPVRFGLALAGDVEMAPGPRAQRGDSLDARARLRLGLGIRLGRRTCRRRGSAGRRGRRDRRDVHRGQRLVRRLRRCRDALDDERLAAPGAAGDRAPRLRGRHAHGQTVAARATGDAEPHVVRADGHPVVAAARVDPVEPVRHDQVRAPPAVETVRSITPVECVRSAPTAKGVRGRSARQAIGAGRALERLCRGRDGNGSRSRRAEREEADQWTEHRGGGGPILRLWVWPVLVCADVG
jgi:hypothetical protein